MMNKILLAAFFLSLTISGQGQNLEFKEENGAITLYEQEKGRFSYQKETKSLQGQYPRANYVHPLYSLGGEVLTEDFPEDHLHHRGIFWSWHQLYVGDKRVSDPWFCEGIRWQVDSVMTGAEQNTASLQARVYWISTQTTAPLAAGDTVLQEQVKIRYTRPDPDYYILDFEIRLIPLREGVKIGGSEDEKGYGGFSVRLKTADGHSFFAKKGEVSPQNTPVEAGGWVEVKGSLQRDAKENGGVVMMCRPEALPSFQGWILRKKESMQNPAFPGRKPILVDQPLRFTNRLIVYRQPLSRQEIESLYLEYLKEAE